MLSVYFPPDGWITNTQLRAAWQAVYGPATLQGLDLAYSVTNTGLEINFGYAPPEVMRDFKAIASTLFPWLTLSEIGPNPASKWECEMKGFISLDSFPPLVRVLPIKK